MARSKRRCATSLHDVSKCTVPKRWSVSSWAKIGCEKAKPAAIEAAATADADLIMRHSPDVRGASPICVVRASRQADRDLRCYQMPPRPTISGEWYSVPYSQQLSSPNVGVSDSKRWPAFEVIYTNGEESERGDRS